MPEPGNVVTVAFPGATGVKRRPAIVVSSDAYHAHRPDVISGVVTSQTAAATTPLDHLLGDWHIAGLRQASAFRAYLTTLAASDVRVIGRLSERDWRAVRTCVARALAGPRSS